MLYSSFDYFWSATKKLVYSSNGILTLVEPEQRFLHNRQGDRFLDMIDSLDQCSSVSAVNVSTSNAAAIGANVAPKDEIIFSIHNERSDVQEIGGNELLSAIAIQVGTFNGDLGLHVDPENETDTKLKRII